MLFERLVMGDIGSECIKYKYGKSVNDDYLFLNVEIKHNNISELNLKPFFSFLLT